MFGQGQRQDDGVQRGPNVNMDLDVTYGGSRVETAAWCPSLPPALCCALPAHCTMHVATSYRRGLLIYGNPLSRYTSCRLEQLYVGDFIECVRSACGPVPNGGFNPQRQRGPNAAPRPCAARAACVADV